MTDRPFAHAARGNTPRAHARQHDPSTSHDAARSVRPKLRASQDAIIVVMDRYIMPLTDEQLVAAYAAHHDVPAQSPSGIRTRRRELVDLGIVIDTGERHTLVSGRRAKVWKLAEPSGTLF